MTNKTFLKANLLSWSIIENKKTVGTLKIPYLQQHFFKFGNASLRMRGESFELTFPKRAADLLGEKEAPVKLLQGSKSIVEVNRGLKNEILEFNFRLWEKLYRVQKSPQGWEVSEGTTLCFTIRSSNGWLPYYELESYKGNWDLPLVIAVFWATYCPLEVV